MEYIGRTSGTGSATRHTEPPERSISESGADGVPAPPGTGVGGVAGVVVGVLGVTVVSLEGGGAEAGEPPGDAGGGTPTTTLPFAAPGFASGPFVGA